MEQSILTDGTVLEENGESVVVNQYSFCELVKELLVQYAGLSYEEADRLVGRSHLAKPIESAGDAGLLGHELPYYWAMSLRYGNGYWQKGIPAQPEDLAAYFEAEREIIRRRGLKEPFE